MYAVVGVCVEKAVDRGKQREGAVMCCLPFTAYCCFVGLRNGHQVIPRTCARVAVVETGRKGMPQTIQGRFYGLPKRRASCREGLLFHVGYWIAKGKLATKSVVLSFVLNCSTVLCRSGQSTPMNRCNFVFNVEYIAFSSCVHTHLFRN